MDSKDISDCIGHDCIIEIGEGIFFRRLIKRKSSYSLVCLNPQTETEEPVIFTKNLLKVAPVIWHRWK